MPPKKKAKVESGPVWESQDASGKWTAYAPEDSALLEKASKGRSKKLDTKDFSFNKGYDTVYTVDFAKMTQLNNETSTSRPIRRLAPDEDAAPSAGADDDVQWEWKDDSGVFVGFYDEDNEAIEKEYAKSPTGTWKTTALSFNKTFKTPYVFDFAKLTQFNTESHTVRQLRRGKKAAAWSLKGYGVQSATPPAAPATPAAAASLYPAHWTPRAKDVDLVPVDLASAEATALLGDFHKTIKRKVKLHSLHRIQNYALWPFYSLTKQHVASRNGGDPKELTLFHGARVRANMDAITNFGFDMRVAATGLYGVGIYFAVNACYSDSGYVLQNPDKSKEMFICRVTTGSSTAGNSALRRPPPKDPKNPTGDLYDSVYNTGKPIIMHIVFNNSQAYPEYVLRYT
eukprot:TRINITY_DN5473_c0_g1_i1.p1 TRINITY_DN5473_c0_g1~~TRINITY_DN5473_c0_g1_i1.p1  ORF type:complete len:399 (+),score=83.62 TRINITY_DN5473_c0_g1_i1:52-1248(+)